MSQRRKPTLFDPDKIAKDVLSALKRDLPDSQLYDLDTRDHARNLFAYRQTHELTKKYKSKAPSKEDLKQVALDGFKNTIARIDEFNNTVAFPRTDRRLSREQSRRDRVLLRARNFIHALLGPLDLEAWFYACKHSGGTTFGLSYERTSLVDKVRFPMSYSGSVNKLFDAYLDWDVQMRTSLEFLNRDSQEPKYMYTQGSRTTTVDKDDTKDRTIAIEPTLNMFFQQGLMLLMYEHLKSLGLDVARVPHRHHVLAYYSSVSRKWATIDFSSASDSVSLALTKFLFPPDWFSAFMSVRTSQTLVDKEWHTLSMLSTMGNATTFPVETLVFTALIAACSLPDDLSQLWPIDLTNKNRFAGGDWGSVFGDDCICRTDVAPLFIEVATSVGFIVNDEKSYYNEVTPFRETCGYDFYNGRNIRPFYLKAPTSYKKTALEPWAYVIMNGLLKKYRLYFGDLTYIYQPGIFEWFSKLVHEENILIKCVPDDFPDDAGLKLNGDARLLDWLLVNHSSNMAPLYDDRHGAVEFTFLSFKYHKKRKRHNMLEYWKTLKGVSEPVHEYVEPWKRELRKLIPLLDQSPEPSLLPYVVKRKGGYVVGTAKQGWLSKDLLSLFYR